MGLVPTFYFQAMYRQNRELLALLQPVVAGLGYELLGIEMNAGRETLLRLYIDSSAGIGLDDCARVSDQVTGVLDVHDPVKEPYRLEVSSPGLDRPLFTMEQIGRYCGHKVKLILSRKLEGRRKLVGEVKQADTEHVVLVMDDNEYRIAADEIDRARLVPDGLN